jgi:hypothetical protein
MARPPSVSPQLSNAALREPAGLARSFSVTAWRAVDMTIENGARRYRRARHLQPLLPLSCPPHDMPEPEATRQVLVSLRRRLGHERRRARSMPRLYDLNRHIALLQALRAETRHWITLRKNNSGGGL